MRLPRGRGVPHAHVPMTHIDTVFNQHPSALDIPYQYGARLQRSIDNTRHISMSPARTYIIGSGPIIAMAPALYARAVLIATDQLT